MHRTFLKLLTNYSSEETPSYRNTSPRQASTLQTRSEVKKMPLRSSLLHLMNSVEGQLQVSYISLPEGKIFFFSPEIRYQKPQRLCSQYQYQIDLIICPLQQVVTCTGTLLPAVNFCAPVFSQASKSNFQEQKDNTEFCCWQKKTDLT